MEWDKPKQCRDILAFADSARAGLAFRRGRLWHTAKQPAAVQRHATVKHDTDHSASVLVTDVADVTVDAHLGVKVQMPTWDTTEPT